MPIKLRPKCPHWSQPTSLPACNLAATRAVVSPKGVEATKSGHCLLHPHLIFVINTFEGCTQCVCGLGESLDGIVAIETLAGAETRPGREFFNEPDPWQPESACWLTALPERTARVPPSEIRLGHPGCAPPFSLIGFGHTVRPPNAAIGGRALLCLDAAYEYVSRAACRRLVGGAGIAVRKMRTMRVACSPVWSAVSFVSSSASAARSWARVGARVRRWSALVA